MSAVSTEEFQSLFLDFRQELLSFLFRLTANRPDAEDLLQDTYLRALDRLGSFEGRSSLKTWTFSIAGNLARDHFRVRRRWREDAQDLCRTKTKADADRVALMHSHVRNSPADLYDFKEHVDYCFTCIGKTLAIEQQLAVLLKDVYGFKIDEIVMILGLTKGKVKHHLAAGRRTMARIFDDRCVLVSKKGVCHQCSEISGFVNPDHDAQIKAMELSMAKAAKAGATQERLYALRAQLVRGVDPLAAPGSSLHTYMLELVDEFPK